MSMGFEVMFPRYLFTRPVTDAKSIAPIKSTVGVGNLVCFGHEPARLPHSTIVELARWVDQQHRSNDTDLNPIKNGASVRISHGPFADHQGLVKLTGSKRVLVLLEIMGKQHALAFKPQELSIV